MIFTFKWDKASKILKPVINDYYMSALIAGVIFIMFVYHLKVSKNYLQYIPIAHQLLQKQSLMEENRFSVLIKEFVIWFPQWSVTEVRSKPLNSNHYQTKRRKQKTKKISGLPRSMGECSHSALFRQHFMALLLQRLQTWSWRLPRFRSNNFPMHYKAVSLQLVVWMINIIHTVNIIKTKPPLLREERTNYVSLLLCLWG